GSVAVAAGVVVCRVPITLWTDFEQAASPAAAAARNVRLESAISAVEATSVPFATGGGRPTIRGCRGWRRGRQGRVVGGRGRGPAPGQAGSHRAVRRARGRDGGRMSRRQGRGGNDGRHPADRQP